VTGGFERRHAHFAKLQLEAIAQGNVRKSRTGLGSDIDSGPGSRRQFFMTRNEICVQMSFKNVANRELLLFRCLQINVHIPLWINDRSLAFRADHVRSVCQATEIELFEIHSRLAGFSAMTIILRERWKDLTFSSLVRSEFPYIGSSQPYDR
jgi:hypothetical protein